MYAFKSRAVRTNANFPTELSNTAVKNINLHNRLCVSRNYDQFDLTWGSAWGFRIEKYFLTWEKWNCIGCKKKALSGICVHDLVISPSKAESWLKYKQAENKVLKKIFRNNSITLLSPFVWGDFSCFMFCFAILECGSKCCVNRPCHGFRRHLVE